MKLVLVGVSGPGRKLRVCSMLKEEMETLEGAGRETHTTAEGEQNNSMNPEIDLTFK